jgi:hypothetical protein
MRAKLFDKDRQIGKFMAQDTRPVKKRIVFLKTSQWAFQDCLEVVAEVVRRLFKERSYPNIDEVYVFPDVKNYVTITNLKTVNSSQP